MCVKFLFKLFSLPFIRNIEIFPLIALKQVEWLIDIFENFKLVRSEIEIMMRAKINRKTGEII